MKRLADAQSVYNVNKWDENFEDHKKLSVMVSKSFGNLQMELAPLIRGRPLYGTRRKEPNKLVISDKDDQNFSKPQTAYTISPSMNSTLPNYRRSETLDSRKNINHFPSMDNFPSNKKQLKDPGSLSKLLI